MAVRGMLVSLMSIYTSAEVVAAVSNFDIEHSDTSMASDDKL